MTASSPDPRTDATAPDWLTLEPGEEVRWRGQPRFRTVYSRVVAGLALAIGAVALGVGLLPVDLGPDLFLWVALAGLFGLTWPVRTYLWVTYTEYVVTTERCYRKSGVLSLTVEAIAFETIQNVGYHQHAWAAIAGYGDVGIDTAGSEGTEMSFQKVEAPAEVQALIERHLRDETTADADRVPGSREQWEAVLGEVRGLRAALEGR